MHSYEFLFPHACKFYICSKQWGGCQTEFKSLMTTSICGKAQFTNNWSSLTLEFHSLLKKFSRSWFGSENTALSSWNAWRYWNMWPPVCAFHLFCLCLFFSPLKLWCCIRLFWEIVEWVYLVYIINGEQLMPMSFVMFRMLTSSQRVICKDLISLIFRYGCWLYVGGCWSRLHLLGKPSLILIPFHLQHLWWASFNHVMNNHTFGMANYFRVDLSVCSGVSGMYVGLITHCVEQRNRK